MDGGNRGAADTGTLFTRLIFRFFEINAGIQIPDLDGCSIDFELLFSFRVDCFQPLIIALPLHMVYFNGSPVYVKDVLNAFNLLVTGQLLPQITHPGGRLEHLKNYNGRQISPHAFLIFIKAGRQLNDRAIRVEDGIAAGWDADRAVAVAKADV